VDGRLALECAFYEPDWWVFSLGEPLQIGLTSPWRLLDKGRIRVSSADHRQQYGLPAPIDGGGEVQCPGRWCESGAVEVREGSRT